MKKLIYILLGAGLCTSCNFLDTEIYDNPDAETIYQDATSCMSGLAGVYDILGYAGTYGQYLWGDLDAGTDILVYNRSYGKDNLQPNLYTHNNTDGYIKDCWLALYDGINRANDFIDLINQRTDEQCGSAKNKKMYIAEARALRALYYMNLVAYWGEVPLRLTPTRDLTTQLLEKSSQEAIYAQIIRDLKAAESGCLPADELNAPGRISRTTAQALLARAYIWQSGYPVYADTWEEARTYAKKLWTAICITFMERMMPIIKGIVTSSSICVPTAMTSKPAKVCSRWNFTATAWTAVTNVARWVYILVYHKGSLPTRMYPTHMLGTTQQKYFTVSTRMGGKIMLEKTRATSAAGGTLPTTATRLMIKPVKYRRIT